ncbi:MAG TPA: hypothetical protein DEV64_09020 [Rhodospirillaceae bacterium]|nr:hypothetical protein [Rhodospirillaceae bacterium]|tara:strand:- start:22301 stop:22510 length:210 start_codon:yes stop_codon:yes gene_type:complete
MAIAGTLVNLSQMTIPLIAGMVFVALFSWFLRKSKRVKRAPTLPRPAESLYSARAGFQLHQLTPPPGHP